MIARIEIVGLQQYAVSEDLEKYVRAKIGKLDRYMPRHVRRTVSAEVKLSESLKKSTKDKNKCEVVLVLPGGRVAAHESTLNMFAAVDIVEEKLKNQLRKYKDKHSAHKADRKGAFSRIRKAARRDFWGSQN